MRMGDGWEERCMLGGGGGRSRRSFSYTKLRSSRCGGLHKFNFSISEEQIDESAESQPTDRAPTMQKKGQVIKAGSGTFEKMEFFNRAVFSRI